MIKLNERKFIIKRFDLKSHSIQEIARLIHLADESINNLVYGCKKETLNVIQKMIKEQYSFFAPPYLKCLLMNDKLVGVLVSFDVSEKKRLEWCFSKKLPKAMGLWNFIRRLPVLFKTRNLISGDMEEEGHYICYLSIKSSYQGQGIGTYALKEMERKNKILYLHVNKENKKGKKFYDKLGFEKKEESTIKLEEKTITNYLLEKRD